MVHITEKKIILPIMATSTLLLLPLWLSLCLVVGTLLFFVFTHIQFSFWQKMWLMAKEFMAFTAVLAVISIWLWQLHSWFNPCVVSCT